MTDNPSNPNGKRYVNIVERPVFTGYIRPNGYLHADLACHALWRYYVSARQTYETERDNLLAYEGDEDSGINLHQAFKGFAHWYGVTPEEMAKHWACVDMQCTALNLPKMPEGDGYRFNKIPELNRKQRRATAKVNKNAASKSD